MAPGGAVWEVNLSSGAPLSFLTMAAATAANGGFHGDGQIAWIADVRKTGEAAPGSGVLCYWSSLPAPGWFTGGGLPATI